MVEVPCQKLLQWVNKMHRVSFFDRKGVNAEKIMKFSFWEKFRNFDLDTEIIRSSELLSESIHQRKSDILIAFSDGTDLISPERIHDFVRKFAKLQLIVIGRDSSYKTTRCYFLNGVYDYLTDPFDESTLEESVARMCCDYGVDYVENELKFKVDALIANIFLGGGSEDFIISEIFEQIFKDWNNDPVNCQIISDKAKLYIYETLIERKPWLEKFLYKDDFTYRFGFSLKSKGELIRIWIMNFKEASAMVTKYQMIDDKLVYKIGKYAVVHVDEKLSLDDVSKGVFLNPSYISHVFKKITNMSFVNFMTEVKIDRAKVLLRDNEMSIKEIAYTLGFANQEYFTKIFKKKMGVTPIMYKQFLMEKYVIEES